MPIPGTWTGAGREPKKQLRSFLGLASWVRRYISNFSRIVEPLRRLTENDVKFEWTEECQKAWDTVIQAVVETRGVYHPDYSLPFHIRTDASADGFGAYLFQIVEVNEGGKKRKEEHVIEFWSRSCPAAMRRYETRRLELMAIILALEHFRMIIEGHRVRLQTDHRNLTFLRDNKSSTGQLARWAMRLDEFSFELDYCPGSSTAMRVPDCLSRNPVDQMITTDENGEPVNEAYLMVHELPDPAGLHVVLNAIRCPSTAPTGDESGYSFVAAEVPDFENETAPVNLSTPFDFVDQANDDITLDEIRTAQQTDSLCTELRAKLPTGTRTRSRGSRSNRKFDLDGGVLYHVPDEGERQIVLPESLRTRAIRLVHEGPLHGHAGRDATTQHVLERFWWPYVQRDVAALINNCSVCARAKRSVPYRHGLLQQPPRIADGHNLGMDLFGPLPESDGHRFLLVMIDQFSHFLTLEVIDSKHDTSILDAFVKGVLLRGHLPLIVTTDNGTEFKNVLFRTFLTQFKMRYRAQMASYHPSSNFTERVNRFIKAMLRILVNQVPRSPTDWPKFAQYVEFVYNTLYIPGTRVSPYMLRFGRQPRLPNDLNLVEVPSALHQSKREYLDHLMGNLRRFHDIVAAAHQKAQQQQRVSYDEHQIDVFYKKGDQVLRYYPKTHNKLRLNWHGPFVITHRVNPATYMVRDPSKPDAPEVPVSVQHLTPIAAPVTIPPHASPFLPTFRDLYKRGKFVIFRKPASARSNDTSWKKKIYVAECYEEYDRDNDSAALHYYSDFGPSDDPSCADPTSALETRLLRPEYHTKPEFRDGSPFAFTNRAKLTPQAEPAVQDFQPHEIEVLATNFDLHGRRVPPRIIAHVNDELRRRDRRHPNLT